MTLNSESTKRARELRKKQTESEELLWTLLRAKQVCGLKFRRQHSIGPFFADFACVSEMTIVELDGAYHDYTEEEDLGRQSYLEALGWCVLRFSNEDVLRDVEAITVAIAREMGFEYRFVKRKSGGSGMMKF